MITYKSIIFLIGCWCFYLTNIYANAAVDPAAATTTTSAAADGHRDFLKAKYSESGVQALASGLLYKRLHHGDGKHHPGPKTKVSFHYTTSLVDGTTVIDDSTSSRSEPAVVTLRVQDLDSLLPGVAETFHLMVEGDQWEAYVPAELAFGAKGNADLGIGPNQVLIYKMEFVKMQIAVEDDIDEDDDADASSSDHYEKLQCNAYTKENCNEEEMYFIDRLRYANPSEIKYDIAHLTAQIKAHDSDHIDRKFSDKRIDSYRRRKHILQQLVTYQHGEQPHEVHHVEL